MSDQGEAKRDTQVQQILRKLEGATTHVHDQATILAARLEGVLRDEDPIPAEENQKESKESIDTQVQLARDIHEQAKKVASTAAFLHGRAFAAGTVKEVAMCEEEAEQNERTWAYSAMNALDKELLVCLSRLALIQATLDHQEAVAAARKALYGADPKPPEPEDEIPLSKRMGEFVGQAALVGIRIDDLQKRLGLPGEQDEYRAFTVERCGTRSERGDTVTRGG